jgi:hypothetical protein
VPADRPVHQITSSLDPVRGGGEPWVPALTDRRTSSPRRSRRCVHGGPQYHGAREHGRVSGGLVCRESARRTRRQAGLSRRHTGDLVAFAGTPSRVFFPVRGPRGVDSAHPSNLLTRTNKRTAFSGERFEWSPTVWGPPPRSPGPKPVASGAFGRIANSATMTAAAASPAMTQKPSAYPAVRAAAGR